MMDESYRLEFKEFFLLGNSFSGVFCVLLSASFVITSLIPFYLVNHEDSEGAFAYAYSP